VNQLQVVGTGECREFGAKVLLLTARGFGPAGWHGKDRNNEESADH
jgi:hypothetical protein